MGLQALRSRVGLADLRTAALPPKAADTFYTSSAWIALRDRVRREAGGRCQVAGCGRIERGMIVDHIVELKDGGAPLDRSNTRLTCRSHHNQKTVTERAKRTARRPGGP
jgi:5-methylcytosine-specific restriction enzyme A